jgi:hypothetical protein
MNHTNSLGGNIDFLAGTASGRGSNYCQLPAGTTTVYFNIRPIKLPTPSPADSAGTPSCNASSCQFPINLSR